MTIQPLHAGLVVFALGILVGMAGLGIPVAALVGLAVAVKQIPPLLDRTGKRGPPPRSSGRKQPKKP